MDKLLKNQMLSFQYPKGISLLQGIEALKDIRIRQIRKSLVNDSWYTDITVENPSDIISYTNLNP